jgi:hypothetical protein
MGWGCVNFDNFLWIYWPESTVWIVKSLAGYLVYAGWAPRIAGLRILARIVFARLKQQDSARPADPVPLENSETVRGAKPSRTFLLRFLGV